MRRALLAVLLMLSVNVHAAIALRGTSANPNVVGGTVTHDFSMIRSRAGVGVTCTTEAFGACSGAIGGGAWITNTAPQSITWDYGAAQTVDTIEILPNQLNAIGTNYTFEWSDDNITWSGVVETSPTFPATVTLQTWHLSTSYTHRYYRINDTADNGFVSMADLNFLPPAGDLLIAGVSATIATTTNNQSDGVPYATPSGWTVCTNAKNSATFYRVRVASDAPSVTFTSQNGAGVGGTGASSMAAYSGVASVDYCNQFVSSATTVAYTASPDTHYFAPAPSMSPDWTTGMYVAFFFDNTNAGNSWTIPVALTTELTNAAQPNIVIADLALSNANPTGGFFAFSNHNDLTAASILLKPSAGGAAASATPTPTIGGWGYKALASGNNTLDWGELWAKDGDLVTVFTQQVGAGVTVSGFTSLYAITGVSAFTKVWHTGDGTTTTVNAPSAGDSTMILTRNPRNAALVKVDASGTTTNTGTSVTSSSLTLKGSNELLVAQFSASVAGTWTYPASVDHNLGFIGGGVTPTYSIQASQQNPANPTGGAVGTYDSSQALSSGSVAYYVLSGGVRHKSQVY